MALIECCSGNCSAWDEAAPGCCGNNPFASWQRSALQETAESKGLVVLNAGCKGMGVFTASAAESGLNQHFQLARLFHCFCGILFLFFFAHAESSPGFWIFSNSWQSMFVETNILARRLSARVCGQVLLA